MSPNFSVRCLLAVSLLSAVACGRIQYQQEGRDVVPQPAAEVSRSAKAIVDESFVILMKNAEKATLYEGLPHQKHEPALLKQEKESKKTLIFGDFAFYEEHFELKEADFNQLKSILSDPDSFRPWSGEKGCGGYHPDYFIEWYADGEICRAYVCFGCGEAKLVGPNGETKYDLNATARTRLENVLLGYHKNRPDSEGWLNITKDYKARQAASQP